MTALALTTNSTPESPPLPCPEWCRSHSAEVEGWHLGEWQSWVAKEGDTPRFEFQMVRHDMHERDGVHIGQTDFSVRVVSGWLGVELEDDDETVAMEGYVLCNDMRQFGEFVAVLV